MIPKRKTFIFLFVILLITQHLHAAQAISTLSVQCTVRKGAANRRSPQLMPSHDPLSTLPDNTKMIGDFIITCPPNTKVKVLLNSTIIQNKKECAITTTEQNQFFKNANCTELWEQNKVLTLGTLPNANFVIVPIYCKRQESMLHLKKGQTMQLISISVLY